jgi:RNA polymerase subunit RPABC4/transcription elongation factor Spt4
MQAPDIQGRFDFIEAAKKESVPSVSRRSAALLRKVACYKCRRVVERVDEEFEQCVSCNAEEIHEAGRLTLLESLPPERARRFAISESERQLLEESGQ